MDGGLIGSKLGPVGCKVGRIDGCWVKTLVVGENAVEFIDVTDLVNIIREKGGVVQRKTILRNAINT